MNSDSKFLQSKCVLWMCLTFMVSGPAFIVLSPTIFDSLLILRPGTIIHYYWKNINIDTTTNFFFFNWTNPEDIYNVSVKPKFHQVGPYRFWQNDKKRNITWNSNGTVTYILQRFWYYDETTKNGDLNDTIITMNPIALGIASVTGKWNYYIRRGISLAFTPYFKKMSLTKTVNELLYKGYPEPLLKPAAAMPFLSYLELPSWDKFGYIHNRNGSLDYFGTFNTGTGVNSTFGEIISWNYFRNTPYFNGDCGRIYGSAGEFFPKNMKKDFAYMYSTEMRGTATLEFEKEELVNGVLGYKYIVGDMMMDNGTIYPQNKCYCNGECVPSGLVNITYMRPGVPMFASLPHFTKADPIYVNKVEGLEPNLNKYEFSITVEPKTGIPIKADIGIQLNLLIQSVPGVPLFENVPKFFFPVLFAQQKFELQGFHLFLVKLLIKVQTVCTFIGIIMIISSIAIIGFIIYRKHKKVVTEAKESFNFLYEQRVPLKIDTQQKTQYS